MLPGRMEIAARLRAYRPAADTPSMAHVRGAMSPALAAQVAAASRQAAVLIGLVERADGFRLVLTQRAAHLRQHAGQVAFPGGRIEPGDASAAAAALREAREEIGLAPGLVEVLGTLDPMVTGTGFRVTPVVGFIADSFAPVADPAEVAAVFEVPLARALDERAYEPYSWQRLDTWFDGVQLYHAGYRIWGATALMLNVLRIVLQNK